MERRHKIEFVLAVSVLLALMLVLFLLLKPKSADKVKIEDDTTNTVAPLTDLIDSATEQTGQMATPQTVSRIFVERLGSYSSESKYENLEVIKEISTQSLQMRIDQLASLAKNESALAYYGVSTRFIFTKELSLDATHAEYQITTQRTEAIAVPSNTDTYYQDIVVELDLVGDAWLVSDYEWLND